MSERVAAPAEAMALLTWWVDAVRSSRGDNEYELVKRVTEAGPGALACLVGVAAVIVEELAFERGVAPTEILAPLGLGAARFVGGLEK